MKKESMLYGIIGLLAGAIIAGFSAAYTNNNNRQDIMKPIDMHKRTTSQGMMDAADMSMSDMTDALKGKTGDAFDEAFLSEMIVHHQGAIDMANLAKQSAKHDEIKNLANDIIDAQAKEIEEMKSWQSNWGYGPSTHNGH